MNESAFRVCGIDISSEHLDLDYLQASSGQRRSERLPNSKPGVGKLLKVCRQQKISLAVMEATAGLERNAHVALHQGGIPVAVVNPVRARRFAQSLGQLAKSDPIDGRVLREMGESLTHTGKLVARAPSSEEEYARQRLSVRRLQLMEMKQMESNRRKQEPLPAMRKSIDAVIAFLEKQIKSVNEQLSDLIKQDEILEETVQIIDAIPGFARTSAIALVSAMPELGRLSRQRAGALAGLACYDDDSGLVKGIRRIRGGRELVRRAMFMPTLTAIFRFGPTKAMYQRLAARPGHKPMQAITACMRKLLVIINARVKEMLSRRAAAGVCVPGLG